MAKTVLILGATGGVGSNLYTLMRQDSTYNVVGWSSSDLDFDYPDRIFSTDLSKFDIIINCAGHNQGTYRGFLDNSWQNQLSQINVNFVANVFLFKHYANSRKQGKYIWISSDAIEKGRPFQAVYAGSKAAGRFTLDLAAKEASHIQILEVVIGLTKSKLRFRNFEGTKTQDEVNATYGDNVMASEYVANKMFKILDSSETRITIV